MCTHGSMYAHSWRRVMVGRLRSGRGWAWLLLLLGGGVLMAVNVGYAHVQAVTVGDGRGPAGWVIAWAMAWAVLTPVMLAVAIRAVTVIRWPGRRWSVLRWCGVAPVLALAGYMSWSHMAGLLRWLGEDWLGCLLAWMATNGLRLLGAGGLLATRTTSMAAGPVASEANGSAPRPTGRIFTPVGGPR